SDEVLYGIVTVMDILKHVGNGEVFKEMVTGNASDVMSVPVRNLVSGNLLTTTPEESLTDIANSMLKKNIGAFPVIYNSTLTGIITEFDLVRALTKI
ncbi:MAG: CBS domain-containing protein, partial [Methanomicrobium sp.]|nr:CBS domain-containing protein [Methanomicrobium sp.]